MRKDLLEARFKGGKSSWKKAKHDLKWGGPAPTGTLGKGSSLKEASKIRRAKPKDIRAAHKILLAERAAAKSAKSAKSLDDVGESLGSKYMANASDNIFGKPHGLLKTPLRVATGGGLTGPLYRAGKVGLKDLWRNEPGEGMYDSLSDDELVALGDQLREQVFPGQGYESSIPPPDPFTVPGDQEQTGREAAEAALESINRARAEQGLPPETLDGQYFPDEDATLANASGRRGSRGRTSDGPESAYVPGSESSYDPEAASSSAPGGPIWDPRRDAYVRAESLTPAEREAFAEITAEKSGLRNKRLNNYDKKGRLLKNVDRYAIDQQNRARKSWDEIQDGYNRDDDMLEIMRARGISGDGGFRGEPGELGRVPTGPGVEDFRRRNIESSRLPKGYSSSANKGLSDMDIHRRMTAEKVARENSRFLDPHAERPSNADLLNPFDNPFHDTMSDARRGELEHNVTQGLDDLEFDLGEEDEAYEPDVNTIVSNLDGSTEHTTDYVDPSQPVFPDVEDSNSTDYADPNEPRPDPDAEAERWNRENPFAGAGEPSSAPPPSLDDIGPPPKRPTQNAPLNFDEEYPDGPEPWMFRPAIDPSTNGTSTTIRDLNDPAPAQWEGELMEGPGTPAPAQWEGDLMPREQDGPVPYAEDQLAGDPAFPGESIRTNYEKIFGDLKDEDGFGTDRLDLGFGSKASMRDFFRDNLSNPAYLGTRPDGQPETLQDEIDKLPSPYRERVMRMVAEGDL